MAEDLLRWRRQSIYASDDDYAFPCETMRGQQLYWPDNLMDDRVRRGSEGRRKIPANNAVAGLLDLYRTLILIVTVGRHSF